MKLSLSIKEACTFTGIGQTKIYEAINEGLLPAKKYGRRTLILQSDLESFLRNLENYSEEKEKITFY